ncbi:uncharacterized protein RCO7_14483 [Rhynchosporium graminicola]|uniref:Uncharacterized protein n=1 Tax=Rhynchosporium graminicola TaxID=2792576 RepID=A0A1E1KJR0_9HELO|nr:uncharacterized protein RCO7_14483 [Rhynchosporium commune]
MASLFCSISSSYSLILNAIATFLIVDLVSFEAKNRNRIISLPSHNINMPTHRNPPQPIQLPQHSSYSPPPSSHPQI